MTKQRHSPLDQIFRTLALRLMRDPHLKVFRSVVVAYAVLVMNGFKGLQRSAENASHHVSVLKFGFPISGSENVALSRLQVPTIFAVFFLFPASKFSKAFWRAQLYSAVRLGEKRLATFCAWLLNRSRDFTKSVTAVLRTASNSSNLGSLQFEGLFTHGAVQGDRRFPEDSSVVSVDSSRHIGIVPKMFSNATGFVTC
jgi:hypothetical protein